MPSPIMSVYDSVIINNVIFMGNFSSFSAEVEVKQNNRLWHRWNRIATVVFLLTAILYVANTWSPSSYGIALEHFFGYSASGPDLGKPRPIRSDEWIVATPLTQATVNNHFQRYNQTSLYKEDLRINYGLPVMDWGIIFKPTMWLYKFVNPAYAYSFHWYAIFSLFIFGYAFLFRQLGASPVIAYGLSFGLYFTGFAQFWWSEKGPIFAFFPWVILPLFSRISIWAKALLLYWLAVCWLLVDFYPPIQISLAFTGAVLLLAYRPELFKFKTCVILILVAGLSSLTTAAYLWDYLQATAQTVYPGGRSVGGNHTFDRFFLSWFFPALNFHWEYEPTIAANISELGTVGMYYYLLIACFLDFNNWRNPWSDQKTRLRLLILGTGFLMMAAWMLLPLPDWVGKPLLWNHVQAARMQFAGGVLLTCLMFVAANSFGLKLSLLRGVILSAIVLSAWYCIKRPEDRSIAEELVFLLLLVIVYVGVRRQWFKPHHGLVTISLILAALLFGRFNPLQPAWPIFNHEKNEIIRNYDALASANNGVLAVQDLPGATANGMGFLSVSHVTPVPHLEFWRRQFPELSAAELNQVFNRYSHIHLTGDIEKPDSPQLDVIRVPFNHFSRAGHLPAHYVNFSSLPDKKDGEFKVEIKDDKQLVLKGWAPWQEPLLEHALEIMITPVTIGEPKNEMMMRPDLPMNTNHQVSALNGFTLRIPVNGNVSSLCLVSLDVSTGRRILLNNPEGLPYCDLNEKKRSLPADYVKFNSLPNEKDGYFNVETTKGKQLILTGWAAWKAPLQEHALEIMVSPGANGAPVHEMMMRSDLPINTNNQVPAMNGFTLSIPVTGKISSLCLVSHDVGTGRRVLLNNPVDLPYCELKK